MYNGVALLRPIPIKDWVSLRRLAGWFAIARDPTHRDVPRDQNQKPDVTHYTQLLLYNKNQTHCTSLLVYLLRLIPI